MLTVTRHASAGLQQRGIPPGVVNELLDFGKEIHSHRGSSILYFDRQARERLRRACGTWRIGASNRTSTPSR